MLRPALTLLLTLLCAVPALAQRRSGTKAEPTFPEAVEAARKAADAADYGAAIAALQAAIRDLQKKQRAAVVAALPRPDGWEIQDDAPPDANDMVMAGVAMVGMTLQRHYSKGEQRIDVEVTANSPFVGMLASLFQNPEIVKAEGGELVEYGPHKAMLKKNGDTGWELQLVMHGKHLIKVSAEGITDEALLKFFDQACVDRLEKPLGK